MIDGPSGGDVLPEVPDWLTPGAIIAEHHEVPLRIFRETARAFATILGRHRSANQRAWVDTFLSVPPAGATLQLHRPLDETRHALILRDPPGGVH